MIFQLCRDARVPILHRDFHRTLTEAMDITLIMDKANDTAPRRGPRVDVQSLGENLADTVEQAQGTDHATSKIIDTTLAGLPLALVGTLFLSVYLTISSTGLAC